jgi:hypothetical protein
MTIDLDSLPATSATVTDDEITLVIEWVGAAPARSVSLEERLRGVVSLSPVEVRGRDLSEVLRLAVDASLGAIESTPGQTLNMTIAARVASAVGYAGREAIREAGGDA